MKLQATNSKASIEFIHVPEDREYPLQITLTPPWRSFLTNTSTLLVTKAEALELLKVLSHVVGD